MKHFRLGLGAQLPVLVLSRLAKRQLGIAGRCTRRGIATWMARAKHSLRMGVFKGRVQ